MLLGLGLLFKPYLKSGIMQNNNIVDRDKAEKEMEPHEEMKYL